MLTLSRDAYELPRHVHYIDSMYGFVCFKHAVSPVGPTVISFAYREPVTLNHTTNQYSDVVIVPFMNE